MDSTPAVAVVGGNGSALGRPAGGINGEGGGGEGVAVDGVGAEGIVGEVVDAGREGGASAALAAEPGAAAGSGGSGLSVGWVDEPGVVVRPAGV